MIIKSVQINNVDISEFTEVIDSCTGNVYLVTDEGDRLNLKSTLCGIIGFVKLIEGGILSGAHIECENQEDETKLFRFNLFGEK